MAKSMAEICKLAGVELGNTSFHDVILNNNEPGGLWLKSGAVAVKLEHYADQMPDDMAKKIRWYAESHRKSEKARAEREKAKAEAQKKAKEDAQKRQDDAIRARIKRANPSATPEQIEALLPKAREAMMLKRTLELPDVPYDDSLRKF
jgi:flagellar biosynthesis GTPase FlhF